MYPIEELDSAARRIWEIRAPEVAGPGDQVVCQFFGNEIIKLTIRREDFKMEQYW